MKKYLFLFLFLILKLKPNDLIDYLKNFTTNLDEKLIKAEESECVLLMGIQQAILDSCMQEYWQGQKKKIMEEPVKKLKALAEEDLDSSQVLLAKIEFYTATNAYFDAVEQEPESARYKEENDEIAFWFLYNTLYLGEKNISFTPQLDGALEIHLHTPFENKVELSLHIPTSLSKAIQLYIKDQPNKNPFDLLYFALNDLEKKYRDPNKPFTPTLVGRTLPQEINSVFPFHRGKKNL